MRFYCYFLISYNPKSFGNSGGNPQVLLEECKYIVKEKTMPEYITDGIEICYDNSDEERNSDEEN